MAFFTSFSALVRGTLARAEQVNALFQSVVDSFDLLGDSDLFTQHRINYAASTSAANTYVVTLDPAPSAYAVGMTLDLVPTNANTGASTINVNGLGAKTIADSAGVALISGALPANQATTIRYNGTEFRTLAAPTTATPGDGTVTPAKLAQPFQSAVMEDTLTLHDPADATKKVRIDAGGITTATTRVLTAPNFDGTIATLAGTETFTNKTLTSPAISGGTINNNIIGGSTPAAGTFTTLTATGQVVISGAGAGQIVFPASQNASANANTFDDYEEGTFTPGMTFNASATGVTFSTQTGRYTKLGDMVGFFIQITLTSNGTGVGAALITGLPFTSGSGNQAVSFVPFTGFASLTAGVCAFVGSGGTTITPRAPTTTGSAAMTDTNITDTALFYAGGNYWVA